MMKRVNFRRHEIGKKTKMLRLENLEQRQMLSALSLTAGSEYSFNNAVNQINASGVMEGHEIIITNDFTIDGSYTLNRGVTVISEASEHNTISGSSDSITLNGYSSGEQFTSSIQNVDFSSITLYVKGNLDATLNNVDAVSQIVVELDDGASVLVQNGNYVDPIVKIRFIRKVSTFGWGDIERADKYCFYRRLNNDFSYKEAGDVRIGIVSHVGGSWLQVLSAKNGGWRGGVLRGGS